MDIGIASRLDGTPWRRTAELESPDEAWVEYYVGTSEDGWTIEIAIDKLHWQVFVSGTHPSGSRVSLTFDGLADLHYAPRQLLELQFSRRGSNVGSLTVGLQTRLLIESNVNFGA